MFIGIIIKYNHGLAAFSFAICIFASGSIIQNFIIDILKLRYKNDKSLLASIIKLFILHKRKPGSYIIHIGIILIVIGITGSSLLGNGKLQVLRPGEEMVLKNYRFEYQGLTRKVFYTKTRVIAKLQVYRGKRRLGDITSEKIFYPGHDQPDTEIGLMSKINEDIYFNLAGWDGDQARIEVNIYPLVSLIWTGALVICIGVVVLVLPVRQEIDYQQGTKSGRGLPGMEVLRVKQLTKKIGYRTILSNINLEVSSGELVVLIGPNGAGKTTFLRILAGLTNKTSGEILIDNKPCKIGDSRIGYLGHQTMLYNLMTVYENLETFGRLYGCFNDEKVEGLLKKSESLL